MPVVSQAQNRAMRSAAAGHSTLGIPASVGREFVNASHGMKVSKLPARKTMHVVHHVVHHHVFGTLAPQGAGHYMGDMPTNPGEI